MRRDEPRTSLAGDLVAVAAPATGARLVEQRDEPSGGGSTARRSAAGRQRLSREPEAPGRNAELRNELRCDLPSLFPPRRWQELGELLGLTRRQETIAQLLCREFTTRGMAERIGISQNTVDTHLRCLYKRLGVQTRIGVVVRLILADRLISSAGGEARGVRDEVAAVVLTHVKA